MKLCNLEITNFRNLEHSSINLSHSINIFYGQNGSGKTSLLEAIHYLGLGRSFRTRNLNRIVHHDANHFAIFSQLVDKSGAILPVGIERKKSPPNSLIKIAGNTVASLVELAQILPLQLINADSHLLLSLGPLVRRQYLDWGVFHVEPGFYYYWQRANRIIKQRNASLKSAITYQDIASWDEALETCANHLHNMRLNYSQSLTPLVNSLLETLLSTQNFTLHYTPGWNTEIPLHSILSNSFKRDRQLGYTQQGPHRADLQLKINSVPAQEILSQGQQKLAAYALRLAQGMLLKDQTTSNCLFLIDDLPSELDSDKRTVICEIIKNLGAQVFVTGIEQKSLDHLIATTTQVFHVEHGKIKLTS